jgi:hypothetical protein
MTHTEIQGQSGAGFPQFCSPPAKNSKAPGGPGVTDGRGVCTTIKRGSFVVKGGDEYRVRSLRGRVAQLETLDGSFAFFTSVDLCALAPGVGL